MYLGVAGACAEQAANASSPLKVDITDVDSIQIVVPLGQNGGSSAVNDITSVATATGGDGSYSFSWTLTEVEDFDGGYSINTQGTTNTATYDTAIIDTNFNNQPPAPPPAPPPPPAPSPAIYRVSCTVTDGNGDTDTATTEFDVEAVG